MRYAIIVLVLCVGSFFFRKYSLRKKEELTQDPLTTPEHFTIKGWNGIPRWPFWFALFFFLILFAPLLSHKDIGRPALIVVSIMPIMLILMPIFVLYVCYIWRIDVDGNTISFRNGHAHIMV